MKSIYLRRNYVTRNYIKTFFFALLNIRMLNLLLNELKQIAKMRRIKEYKSMSKERILNTLDESESAKSLDNAKIEKIKEDFNKLRDRFLKPKVKEIRKYLYEIKNKNLSESELKEI